MKVKISFEELLFDVRSRSHSEADMIADPETRYKVETGSERDDLVKRCAITADARMRTIASRFLPAYIPEVSVNDGDTPSSFIYLIEGGERRLGGKGDALSQMIHSALVHLTLAEYYISVGQGDLSTAHDQKGHTDLADAEALLYTKRPPEPLHRWRPGRINE